MVLADDGVLAQPPSFEQDILPLLAKKCHACHGADDQQAQLDLRSLSEIMRGGENGPAGEFGRLPITEGADGRDHNRHAFSTLMAGGGFKAGHIHGATDEFGYKSVENRVSVPDLHATILSQLGIDHTKLTFVHSGRPERLVVTRTMDGHEIRSLMNSRALRETKP